MSNGVDFKKISLESRELLNSALAREAALREELKELREAVNSAAKGIKAGIEIAKVPRILLERLTVAEQRADELEGLLRETLESGEWFSSALEFQNRQGFELCAKIDAALKPAEDYNELDDDEDLEVFDDQ